MYAVFQAGGRQYKVAEGDVIHLDYFEAPVGAQVTFDEVLLTGGDSTAIGMPFVDGAEVLGEVLAQTRGPKHIIFKHRRRHDSKVKRGFRAHLTQVKIAGIKA